MFSSLSGRSVFPTGARSGIGVPIARQFAIRGARTLISARNPGKIKAVTTGMRVDGQQVQGQAASVADAAPEMALIQASMEKHGGLNVLCCNAVTYLSGALESLIEADRERVMRTNAKGTFLCKQASLPLRLTGHGRVILTSSSTGSVTGSPGWTDYGASKAAQLGLCVPRRMNRSSESAGSRSNDTSFYSGLGPSAASSPEDGA